MTSPNWPVAAVQLRFGRSPERVWRTLCAERYQYYGIAVYKQPGFSLLGASLQFMFIALEYAKIVLYLALSFGLSFLLLKLSMAIASKEYDAEKLSAYECGFTPLGDARQAFHVRFYVVGILFILFDLEVVFIFPWAVALETLKLAAPFALWSMTVFLALLTLGFVYEWKKGALEWE